MQNIEMYCNVFKSCYVVFNALAIRSSRQKTLVITFINSIMRHNLSFNEMVLTKLFVSFTCN